MIPVFMEKKITILKSLLNASIEEDVIFDQFSGTGTASIAAMLIETGLHRD
jgi:DNA modification methylase